MRFSVSNWYKAHMSLCHKSIEEFKYGRIGKRKKFNKIKEGAEFYQTGSRKFLKKSVNERQEYKEFADKIRQIDELLENYDSANTTINTETLNQADTINFKIGCLIKFNKDYVKESLKAYKRFKK